MCEPFGSNLMKYKPQFKNYKEHFYFQFYIVLKIYFGVESFHWI